MGAHTWLGYAMPGFATEAKANLTVLSELRTIDPRSLEGGYASLGFSNVTLQRAFAGYLAEGSFVGSKKVPDRVLPRQFFLYPPAPKLAHPLSLLGMVEQPENFFGEIGDPVRTIGVQRCFLRADLAFS